MAATETRADKLWAITSYFNPMGYRRRLTNYRDFRSALTVPLVAVELSFGEPFELVPGDADILIQRRGGDIMWQKERLLNIALTALPAACEQVVWFDCDVAFQRADWARTVSRKLEDAPLVQPFSRVYHLPADVLPHEFDPDWPLHQQPSTISVIKSGRLPDDCVGRAVNRGPGTRAAGFAWAARRELLDQHGLFDGAIVGGGDNALICAAYGNFDRVNDYHAMNEDQVRYYRRWALPFHNAVRGQVSYSEGDILHLWHGDLDDRQGYMRHRKLGQFEFDPHRDIAPDRSGSWRWNSDKPALHQYLKDYFAARNEDGRLPLETFQSESTVKPGLSRG